MKSEEIRQKFFDYFKSKGHKIIPSSSLIPNDPTSLFVSAGMQQLVPYLDQTKDVVEAFGSRHLASCQKCFRTVDIDEIGDDTHHTFFEMLGNWSIGQDPETGYFKEKAIEYALDFFCNYLGLDKSRMWITVFKGKGDIPKDEEAINIWQKNGIPRERIVEFGMEDNFWGPVTETGPCGPCSEIHYDRGEEFGCGHPDCGPNCPRCNRFVELWNLVFMEYNRRIVGEGEEKQYEYARLPQKNIDTGIGFERITSILQGKNSAYETDLFWPIILKLEELSGKKYEEEKKRFRIIADHLRSISFLVSAEIEPSNLGRGYILRRLLRRVHRSSKAIGLGNDWEKEIIKWVIAKYGPIYSELEGKEEKILKVINEEKEKFESVLREGTKNFEKLISRKNKTGKGKNISGEEAFFFYETYGFPLEVTLELAEENGFTVDKDGFDRAFQRHQEISRRGAEKKFGGTGIDKIKDEKSRIAITKLHTATHLLQAALRKVLGPEVKQMGSDITPERLRFDFSFNRKMTEEEIKRVEDLVNEKIKENLEVKFTEMPLQEALNQGALAFFKEKYPEKVKIYEIFNPKTGEVFSKEICAGPHVAQTKELGKFKILKEQSSSRGVRRIKAVLN